MYIEPSDYRKQTEDNIEMLVLKGENPAHLWAEYIQYVTSHDDQISSQAHQKPRERERETGILRLVKNSASLSCFH